MDRCSEGAAPYKGPVIWPIEAAGTAILAGDSSDWPKLKNPGAPALGEGR